MLFTKYLKVKCAYLEYSLGTHQMTSGLSGRFLRHSTKPLFQVTKKENNRKSDSNHLDFIKGSREMPTAANPWSKLNKFCVGKLFRCRNQVVSKSLKRHYRSNKGKIDFKSNSNIHIHYHLHSHSHLFAISRTCLGTDCSRSRCPCSHLPSMCFCRLRCLRRGFLALFLLSLLVPFSTWASFTWSASVLLYECVRMRVLVDGRRE